MEDPRAYIPSDRRQALVGQRTIDEHAHGAALFADISGFTPLTEVLANELGPRRGAEELAVNLNRMFEELVDDLHSFGGEVLYFSGDAITCWIDGDDGTRAATCGLRMQETISRVGRVTTTAGTTVELAIKVAIAVGHARRFVVGDPDIQLIDVLAGELIDHLAAAEQLAQKGDVVLDQSAVESLGDAVVLRETRIDDTSGRACAILDSVRAEPPRMELNRELEAISDDEARKWLLPTVYQRIEAGGGDFFAELRPAYPMFVRFEGIEYDNDPEAIEKLDTFIRASQDILDRYGGGLLQLTLGDKGAYLYAAFGAPVAHEDDAVRAVSAARELEHLDDSTAVRGIQIGVATGRVFSGTYGHSMRRTFTCLGDAVNLAARLMGRAAESETLVSQEVFEATGDRFSWTALEPLKLKGKAEAVTAHRLDGVRERSVERVIRYPLPMVGREKEVSFVMDHLDRAMSGSRHAIGILAEAGLGKSRLVAEVVRTMRAAGHFVTFGEAQAFGQNTRYLIWREVWRTLLGVDDGIDQSIPWRVAEELSAINPSLVVRAPLLAGVLGVDIPDNEVTAAFDAKLRKTSLEGLLVDVLKARLRDRPRVVVLEDAHWIDQASLDLLEVLIRETAGLPLLVLVAYRSEIGEETRSRFRALSSFEELELHELTPEAVERVILSKLDQQFGETVAPSREAIRLIVERGQGNPFYIEELINYLRRADIDIENPSAVKSLELPRSLHALVLSRVDALHEEPRRTLKVASVIGREFDSPTLPGVYPDLGPVEVVEQQLDTLRDADLVTRDREDDDSWLFRHAVTRDVAYESLPFSLRAMLHESAGNFIERRDPAAIGVNLDLLAHHYWHSDNAAKKIEYQRRAGEAAKAAYANDSAILYFERLAEVVDETDRADALLRLGQVLELVGEWARAESVETEALELARAAGDGLTVGWCEAALAEVARKQGRFEEVAALLDRALSEFDAHDELAGKGRVLHLAGTLAAQRGELDTARDHYEASLRIREDLGDQAGMASLLSNLGIVEEYSGNYDASCAFHERALEARIALGDRWAIANSKTNLGMIAVLQERFDDASTLFEEAMRLNREVGDTWHTALSHHNLGNAKRGLGDSATARRQYLSSAGTYRRYGDRWGFAFLLEDVAVLAASEGDSAVALELLGAADRMREEIDAARGSGLEEELRTKVIDADPTFGDAERVAARARGRSLDFASAADRAMSYCRET